MAKQMTFDGPDGVSHSSSYWLPVQININKIDKTGNIVFLGFHDSSARQARRQPIGARQYNVSPTLYDTFFSATAQQPAGVDMYRSAYLMAMSVLEGEPPKAGELDTRTSFFYGAMDV